jgi:hypothetical protein
MHFTGLYYHISTGALVLFQNIFQRTRVYKYLRPCCGGRTYIYEEGELIFVWDSLEVMPMCLRQKSRE